MITEIISKNVTLEELNERVDIIAENLDGFFLFTMGVMISLMQIGFGYLEVGSIDSKNATNVMFKNMMDSFICGFVYWLVGYTLAFGEGSSFAGLYPYIAGYKLFEKKQFAHWFFQISYASTPSTIVSGAIVGRISFVAYIVYSALISGVVYPIVSHWAWTPEGWLVLLGFKDFCGSGVIHLVGGTCAIVGAYVLGPRIGRFPKPGTELSYEEKLRFLPHNAVASGLGGMIIFTGFFAFNGGSVLHITKAGDAELVGKIMINTWLSAGSAIFGTLLIVRTGIVDGEKRWTLLHCLNAGLSGMAAVCAHADAMDTWMAVLNGFVISLTYCGLTVLVAKLKIDDPINVIAVHFGGGLWGCVGASLFRSDTLFGGFGTYAGHLLAYNLIGAIAIMTWSAGCSLIIFLSLKYLGLLRVSPEHELLGADYTKHKEQSYTGIPCTYLEQKKFDTNSDIGTNAFASSTENILRHRSSSVATDLGTQFEREMRTHYSAVAL